ncbi:hypothetical protein D9X91_16490 [Falsibacillus albus]|uniref:Lipoprotein n=1 Tax=Falsibacillus albus TaxID=2478915 RepID=A0A3L7JRZ0_9BACI|nr:hypothetical protein D9X91_16490 [Falsibacillus albus]
MCLLVSLLCLLAGCSHTKSLQDTFKRHHSKSEIIKVLKVNDEDIVLYLSDKNYKISAAEYSKVNNQWKMVSDVSENNTGKLSFGFTHKGQKNEVLFGQINDPRIKKVQLKKGGRNNV